MSKSKRKVVSGILPSGVRQAGRGVLDSLASLQTAWHHAQWRRKTATASPGSRLKCLEFTVRINDGPNFYVLYNDIILQGIYRFTAMRPDPFILDCGSNIGMSILYFKHLYPQARIIGFEPDPGIVGYLHENVKANGLADIQVVQAAIGGREGSLTFYSDGKYGSCLAHLSSEAIPDGWTRYEIPCVRLSDYLNEPVDFLKMNIEGAEWEALADCGDRLQQVHEMAIEYHHLPGLPRTLHKILSLLDELGFEYVVSDFDLATYSGARTPVVLNEATSYFRHIYAIQRG